MNSKIFAKRPNLARDPICPLLFRYALPAILTYLISELYNMVDTYYVGNYVGANAIGALGTVFPVQRMIIALSLLFSYGAANQMVYYRGQGNYSEADAHVKAAMGLNFLIMLPYTILVFLLRADLMPAIGARGALLEPALEYLSIIIWGACFLTTSTIMAKILLTFGKALLSVILSASGAIINIIVDAWLVKHLHMGIHGAAYATLISQITCCILTFFFYLRLVRKENLSLGLNFQPRRLWNVFRTGLPSFVVESEDAVVMPVLNILLFQLAGENGINVHAVNTKIYMFLFVIFLGFAYGMQTIVAYNYGARNYQRILKTVKLTALISFLATLLCNLPLYLATESAVRIFVKDEALISLSLETFPQMIVALPLLAFYYLVIMFFQALGKGKIATPLTLLRQILILLPAALIAVNYLGFNLQKFYYLYPFTDILATLIAISSFFIFYHLKLKSHLPQSDLHS